MNTLPENPAGFWMSEKMDGCRFLWTGERFLTRNGKDLNPPAWFTRGLPPCRLDGELTMGRGTFKALVSTVQTKGGDWAGCRFEIFDLAELHTPIEARLAKLAALPLPPHCGLVRHRLCTGWDDLDREESRIVAAGGEGVCLRPPASHYRPGNFIKIKRLFADLDRSQLD